MGAYGRTLANMLLTETESARFWPLDDEYRAKRQKIGDRRVDH
jgi:hypothetical protein